MGSPELKCMNCACPVGQSDGEFFAGVFLCGDCNTVATRLYERGSSELKLVLSMLKDAIRMAIVQKKLQFNTPEQIASTSRTDLLDKLSDLVANAREKDAANS